MKNVPELSEIARHYEDFLHNPDAISQFEKTEVFVEGFRKVFRRHARVMAEFWERQGFDMPRSAQAPYLKYTDAYMQTLYDDERRNMHRCLLRLKQPRARQIPSCQANNRQILFGEVR